MTPVRFLAVLSGLKKQSRSWKAPVVQLVMKTGNTPFRILIATLLSARTRDQVTALACERLFARAQTPRAMLAVSPRELEKFVYPVGFFRAKAAHVLELCRILLDRHGGKVPDTLEELLALPGVGRKTANLVLGAAFGKAAVCVDVHVHRICNRLGLVKTRTPEETEREIMRLIPEKRWSGINEVLVAFGQTVCQPARPRCGACRIEDCPSRRVP